MKATELLPIGSVVQVKDTNKAMMIIGILQRNVDKEYDYIAVLYPEGYLAQDQIFLFNHSDIDKMLFIGFMNSEHQVLRGEIDRLLSGEQEK